MLSPRRSVNFFNPEPVFLTGGRGSGKDVTSRCCIKTPSLHGKVLAQTWGPPNSNIAALGKASDPHKHGKSRREMFTSIVKERVMEGVALNIRVETADQQFQQCTYNMRKHMQNSDNSIH